MSDSSAQAVVDRQMVAYNNRDLEGFIDCYGETLEVYDISKGAEKQILPKESFKETMAKLFATSPNLNGVVEERIIHGNRVVDKERVTGYRGDDEVTKIVTYIVENNLITRLYFL